MTFDYCTAVYLSKADNGRNRGSIALILGFSGFRLGALNTISRMDYSGTGEFVLFGLWAVGSLLLAWFVRRRFYAYVGSVALSAPAIAYAMVGYGLLPMGGIFHAIMSGLYVLPFHYFFQRSRNKISN
jgi:hypothetical protein